MKIEGYGGIGVVIPKFRASLIIVLFMIVASYLEVTLDGLIALFTSGFDFSNAADVGAYLRKEQFLRLGRDSKNKS